jgi:hypothetical protein
MPTSDDKLPRAFGYKMAWLALPTEDGAQVVKLLGLKPGAACTWAQGIAKIYEDQRSVFVTPAVKRWTFVVGWPMCPASIPYNPHSGTVSQARLGKLLEPLSAKFGSAYMFSSHRVVEAHAWAFAEHGRLVRVFDYCGESGEHFQFGLPTSTERELRACVVDENASPNEETVMMLAGRWTVNPTTFDSLSQPTSNGWIGSV